MKNKHLSDKERQRNELPSNFIKTQYYPNNNEGSNL